MRNNDSKRTGTWQIRVITAHGLASIHKTQGEMDACNWAASESRFAGVEVDVLHHGLSVAEYINGARVVR